MTDQQAPALSEEPGEITPVFTNYFQTSFKSRLPAVKKLMPWKDKANQAAFRVEEGMVLSINLEIHCFPEGDSLQMLFLFLQSMVVS